MDTQRYDDIAEVEQTHIDVNNIGEKERNEINNNRENMNMRRAQEDICQTNSVGKSKRHLVIEDDDEYPGVSSQKKVKLKAEEMHRANHKHKKEQAEEAANKRR
eukprot:14029000-Heterocapsa_arctica.AAC.1